MGPIKTDLSEYIHQRAPIKIAWLIAWFVMRCHTKRCGWTACKNCEWSNGMIPGKPTKYFEPPPKTAPYVYWRGHGNGRK